MKKYFKIITLFCLMAMSVIVLSSCNMLDDLREQRIVALDEDYEVLEYKGNKYMVLENFYDRQINFLSSKTCYVVEEDVPLLFLDSFGMWSRYSEDNDLIEAYGKYYCTFDKHEKYTDILKNGKLDHYRVSCWVYDEETDMMDTEYIVLDERTTDLIKGTIDNTIGQEVNYFNYNYEFLWIDACDSENLLIEKNAVQLYYDSNNNKYGIVLSESSDGITVIKEFPENGYNLIADLFAKSDYDLQYNEYR